MVQTMGHVEFVLYFVSEKIFLLLQHHSKIKKRFDLGAVLQQHFVILRATKIILKPQGAMELFSRACNATYSIKRRTVYKSVTMNF